ncbi:MAG: cytochrome c3 family protein [Candidatus Acidiferrales bacterium]
MAQIFNRTANIVSKASIVAVGGLVALLGGVLWTLMMSPYYTNVNLTREQPVPFSHKHHAGELGIDCRYCHTSVEKSSFAGVPPTQTCMTCHSQIWTNAPMLEPVRASYRDNKSISWIRVNALPDYVYFNHSIHVAKGVGCTTCHGPIAEMPLTYKANTLYMGWCINCHRQPEKYLRPKSEVFNPNYVEPANQMQLGAQLVKDYKIQSLRTMQSCSTCHR